MAKFNHPFDPSKDQHADHANFLKGITSQQKIRLRFFSKEDGAELERECAPMDFGPSNRTAESSNRYHSWDFESDQKNHTLSLLRDQIKQIELLDESFDPTEFVKWTPAWFTKRDWGQFS